MSAKNGASKPRTTSAEDLVHDERNANRHTPRGRQMLEESISRYGAGRSVVVDKNHKLIGGNLTADVAQELGLETIEVATRGDKLVVVVREDLDLDTDPQARQLAYADNRVAQVSLNWDPEQLLTDRTLIEGPIFTSEELRALLPPKEKAQRDPEPRVGEIEALKEKWGTERGQLWEVGRHRLMCADSTDTRDLYRLMDGEAADCVFTSPPYAVGLKYESYEDTIENLRALLARSAKVWLEVVADGGFAVVNFNDIAAGSEIAGSKAPCEYPMALEHWPPFREEGWLLWSRRVWLKPTPAVRSLHCIGSNRAATDWEHIWTWRKPGKPLLKRQDGEYSSVNGWIDTTHIYDPAHAPLDHPAGMPTRVAVYMLSVHSRPDAIVYEPFAGTGTTMVAAQQSGRRCYAADIDPGYVAITLQRMADMGVQGELQHSDIQLREDQ